jgi:hypothetical protein
MPNRMLARGSTSTRVDCDAANGPAWKAFWVKKRPASPNAIEAVGLPVHEEADPVPGGVVTHHLDQSGREGE